MASKKMKEFRNKCSDNRKKLEFYNTVDIGTSREKLEMCNAFFNGLVNILADRYEVLPSCNKDNSRYLVPKGTADQVSYYGKPVMSFRVSDHWNWYSNLDKCQWPTYIQCNSDDVMKAKLRENETHGTNARRAYQVAVQMSDGRYHHVFGEKWDRSKRIYNWVETNPETVCHELGLI